MLHRVTFVASIPQCKNFTTPNPELLAECAAVGVGFISSQVAESYIGKPTSTDASLVVAGERHELPVRKGSLGPDVIDITTLYAETGHFTYDPSFTSTASCESKITFIDGEKGVLLYRGYPIDQLAEHGTFMETCYLLLYGELPTKEQYETFCNLITRHTMVHEQMTRFYTGFRRDAHPMAVMVGVVGALSAF